MSFVGRLWHLWSPLPQGNQFLLNVSVRYQAGQGEESSFWMVSDGRIRTSPPNTPMWRLSSDSVPLDVINTTVTRGRKEFHPRGGGGPVRMNQSPRKLKWHLLSKHVRLSFSLDFLVSVFATTFRSSLSLECARVRLPWFPRHSTSVQRSFSSGDYPSLHTAATTVAAAPSVFSGETVLRV